MNTTPPSACPFCHSDNTKHYPVSGDSPDITCCLDCKGSTGEYWTEGQSLVVWNNVWLNMNNL